ncbi:MAG: 50S ribosomal protein L29 [Sphingobacteriia bacterium]|jgi:large subunit ribosomal protein L29|nr:50S ribosomal protein L29 [Sphingobacteriia bacterium]
MKSKEIRELNNEEIIIRIREEEEMMNKIRFNHAISAVENPLKIRKARKNIARLKTILQERTINQPSL